MPPEALPLPALNFHTAFATAASTVNKECQSFGASARIIECMLSLLFCIFPRWQCWNSFLSERRSYMRSKAWHIKRKLSRMFWNRLTLGHCSVLLAPGIWPGGQRVVLATSSFDVMCIVAITAFWVASASPLWVFVEIRSAVKRPFPPRHVQGLCVLPPSCAKSSPCAFACDSGSPLFQLGYTTLHHLGKQDNYGCPRRKVPLYTAECAAPVIAWKGWGQLPPPSP